MASLGLKTVQPNKLILLYKIVYLDLILVNNSLFMGEKIVNIFSFSFINMQIQFI